MTRIKTQCSKIMDYGHIPSWNSLGRLYGFLYFLNRTFDFRISNGDLWCKVLTVSNWTLGLYTDGSKILHKGDCDRFVNYSNTKVCYSFSTFQAEFRAVRTWNFLKFPENLLIYLQPGCDKILKEPSVNVRFLYECQGFLQNTSDHSEITQ